MTAPHLHLLLNEWPIMGIFIGVGLLCFGWYRAEKEWVTAGLVLFVLMSMLTIGVYVSGTYAHEAVEDIPAVDQRHDLLHDHEDLGWYALVALLGLGGVSLVALIYARRRDQYGRVIVISLFLLALASLYFYGRVAHYGAHIRHPEIAVDYQPVQPPQPSSDSHEGHSH